MSIRSIGEGVPTMPASTPRAPEIKTATPAATSPGERSAFQRLVDGLGVSPETYASTNGSTTFFAKSARRSNVTCGNPSASATRRASY